MNFPEQIFKAYDVRGKVGTELTPEVTQTIGASFGSWLPENGPVAVGYDMRPDSKALADGFIKGLVSVGRDVWDIGQITTDMIYFTVGNFELAGGAVITASHNPGDDNGIKMCREKAIAIGVESGLVDIKEMAMNESYELSEQKSTVTERDLTNEWVEFALSFVKPETWPKYNVPVDAGNGMAGKIIPFLTPKVPLVVDPMYFDLDGTFPNHIANPLVPENVVDLQKRIKDTGADFGIAFDGDGDRAALIDENGDQLSGTVTAALLAQYFLLKNPGATILYNAVCGRLVPELVAEMGGKSERTKVGHSYIKADMRRFDALFAGEHSGHYYFKKNYYADSGLIAVLVVIQVLAESGKTMSQLVAEFRERYVSIHETNFTVNDKQVVLDKIASAFSDYDSNTLDGLTVNFEDGWINVRPSNTEPLLRLNAEAKTSARLEEIVAQVSTLITEPV